MNLRVLKFIILTLMSPCLAAVEPKEKIVAATQLLRRSISAPSILASIALYQGAIPINIWIHHYTPGNMIQRSWIKVGIPEHMPFREFKEVVATTLKLDCASFKLQQAGLDATSSYDQESEKTLAELGITNKTNIWAVDIKPEN